MQLRLPWAEPVGRDATRQIIIDGRPVAVTIARHRRARRYVIRLAPDGGLRLTVPRGASIAGGLAFAERQSDWIRQQAARRIARSAPWRDGTLVWFRGEQVALAVAGDAARIGAEQVPLSAEARDIRAAVTAHLRRLAEQELPSRCLAYAADVGLTVARVSVRNQRSRWGACSARGVITLNWRLVQMPPSVRDYVILHELMHLRQPNHSRRFWREVERVCAWWRDAERWLRKHGRDVLE
jgi:predicted metal-dependent hydrolase